MFVHDNVYRHFVLKYLTGKEMVNFARTSSKNLHLTFNFANPYWRREKLVFYTAKRNMYVILELLLSNGADPYGVQPPSLLKFPKVYTPVEVTSKLGNLESLQRILYFISNLRASKRRYPLKISLSSALDNATRGNHIRMVKYITPLIEDEHSLSSCLTTASELGNFLLVKYFLSKGADFSYADSLPIKAASKMGYYQIVKILLEAKADPCAEDNLPIRLASENGHTKIVKALLRTKADPLTHENACIVLACQNGHEETVGLLLKVKADPSVDGNYPAELSAGNGHIKVLELLLKSGVEINSKQSGIYQAALEKGHNDICKLLETKMPVSRRRRRRKKKRR